MKHLGTFSFLSGLGFQLKSTKVIQFQVIIVCFLYKALVFFLASPSNNMSGLAATSALLHLPFLLFFSLLDLGKILAARPRLQLHYWNN